MLWKCVERNRFRLDGETEYGMQRIIFKTSDRRGQIIMEVGIAAKHAFEIGEWYQFPTASEAVDPRLIDTT